ncbi:MAG TPA: zf-HC2 domain-containing protein [Gaiellaceae bacterium]|nr:zf-HC2 domain-containing protein [Gaiellaceae bacterium]
MDCQTFDASLIDALYDELDADTSRSFDEHAAGCSSCATALGKLNKTRTFVRPGLEVDLPDGLEARVLAATEAAMDAAEAPAAASPAVNGPDPAGRGSGEVISIARKRGGIVAFLSRPQLAIAATFIVVLGAVAMLTRASREAAPTAASEAPPAAEEARGPAPVAAATVAASAVAYATAPAVPAAAPAPDGDLALAGLDAPNERTSAAARARAGGKSGSARGHDPAFDAAKALFDAGRYAEALPRFEALAPADPEAELYAARCIANTKGCGPAIARYDSAARRNAGSASGSQAALEAARCSNRSGQVTAARTRYEDLAEDPHVASEANAELSALGASKAAAKAAKPAATAAAPPATATATAPATKAAPKAPTEGNALE